MNPWLKETLGLQVGDTIIWQGEAIEVEGQPVDSTLPKGMSLDIVNGDAVLLSIHFYPRKCLHQPGAVSPLLQHRSLQTNSDLREPLEYNWSWEESVATSLFSPPKKQ